MKIKNRCTLGPASFDQGVIEGLDGFEVDLFRIDLSHAAEDVAGAIESSPVLRQTIASTPKGHRSAAVPSTARSCSARAGMCG